MTTGVACRGIVIHNGKVLLVNDPVKKRGWMIPGGQISDGELPESCVKREIKEETNIDVEVGDIFHTYLVDLRKTASKYPWFVVLVFKTTPKTFDIKSGPEDEARWFSPAELKDINFYPLNRTPLIKIGFLKEVQTTL